MKRKVVKKITGVKSKRMRQSENSKDNKEENEEKREFQCSKAKERSDN